MKEYFLIALEATAIITAAMLTIIFLVWTFYITSPSRPVDGSYQIEWKYQD